MVVIDDRPSHIVGEIVRDTDDHGETSRRNTADTRGPWVAPAWDRRDTPMEVTMYAGQR
jgi:hypothetical protein